MKQVAITPVDSPQRSSRIQILWHTGASTELVAMRLTTQDKLRTPAEVVQTVRELAVGRTDDEIASELNQRGLKSGLGRAFTGSAVAWIRWKFQIEKPGSDPGFARRVGMRSDGSYSTSALADRLGVGIHTIHYWRKVCRREYSLRRALRQQGILQASQETPRGPWWHRVTPEILNTLRDKIRRVPVKSE